jgi:hypothetical protein
MKKFVNHDSKFLWRTESEFGTLRRSFCVKEAYLRRGQNRLFVKIRRRTITRKLQDSITWVEAARLGIEVQGIKAKRRLRKRRRGKSRVHTSASYSFFHSAIATSATSIFYKCEP